MLDFKESGVDINAKWYANDLKCFRISIKNKRPRKLIDGVIILHDNSRSHLAQMVQDLLGCMN